MKEVNVYDLLWIGTRSSLIAALYILLVILSYALLTGLRLRSFKSMFEVIRLGCLPGLRATAIPILLLGAFDAVRAAHAPLWIERIIYLSLFLVLGVLIFIQLRGLRRERTHL